MSERPSSTADRAPLPDTLRGALWMLAAALGFAVMNGIIRQVSADLHPFVIAFFRNLFSLTVMLPWLIRTGLGGLRTERFGLHLLRAAVGVLAMLSWFWALAVMPLAEAVAVNFTAPLFTTVLAALVLGEVVRVRRWTATLIGFGGVLIILRPGAELISAPALAVIFASLMMATAGIAVKSLSRTEAPSAIVTYFVLLATPLSLAAALFVWTTPSWTALAWLAALGACATFANSCMTRAFAAAEASAVVPFDYARLPLVALIGYLAYDERPDAWMWLGAAVIAAASIYIAHREAKLGRARVSAATAGDRAGAGAYRDDTEDAKRS